MSLLDATDIGQQHLQATGSAKNMTGYPAGKAFQNIPYDAGIGAGQNDLRMDQSKMGLYRFQSSHRLLRSE
ncbi:hypothetical protein [Edaphobacter aggregans]|uniref:hypothetical protein n=1 Tax=Edaphobacter aggregans TaxID=570835 RepID=UPI000551595C|nr:hypothetical protein [Edaphobacter aggregans]